MSAGVEEFSKTGTEDAIGRADGPGGLEVESGKFAFRD
jgi:hypothetical protein